MNQCPTQRQYDYLLKQLLHPAAAVAIMRSPDAYSEWLPVVEALYDRLDVAARSVQGNRPHGSPMTWSDTRLIAAAMFRIFLEELERP